MRRKRQDDICCHNCLVQSFSCQCGGQSSQNLAAFACWRLFIINPGFDLWPMKQLACVFLPCRESVLEEPDVSMTFSFYSLLSSPLTFRNKTLSLNGYGDISSGLMGYGDINTHAVRVTVKSLTVCFCLWSNMDPALLGVSQPLILPVRTNMAAWSE